MYKIDAILREEKLEEIKDALQAIHVHGMTVSQVLGCGTQMGYQKTVRGRKVDVNLLPKLKIEVVVSSRKWADRVADLICSCAQTGEHGDGKIFMYELADCVRIRTGEHGPQAVWSQTAPDDTRINNPG